MSSKADLRKLSTDEKYVVEEIYKALGMKKGENPELADTIISFVQGNDEIAAAAGDRTKLLSVAKDISDAMKMLDAMSESSEHEPALAASTSMTPTRNGWRGFVDKSLAPVKKLPAAALSGASVVGGAASRSASALGGAAKFVYEDTLQKRRRHKRNMTIIGNEFINSDPHVFKEGIIGEEGVSTKFTRKEFHDYLKAHRGNEMVEHFIPRQSLMSVPVIMPDFAVEKVWNPRLFEHLARGVKIDHSLKSAKDKLADSRVPLDLDDMKRQVIAQIAHNNKFVPEEVKPKNLDNYLCTIAGFDTERVDVADKATKIALDAAMKMLDERAQAITENELGLFDGHGDTAGLKEDLYQKTKTDYQSAFLRHTLLSNEEKIRSSKFNETQLKFSMRNANNAYDSLKKAVAIASNIPISKENKALLEKEATVIAEHIANLPKMHSEELESMLKNEIKRKNVGYLDVLMDKKIANQREITAKSKAELDELEQQQKKLLDFCKQSCDQEPVTTENIDKFASFIAGVAADGLEPELAENYIDSKKLENPLAHDVEFIKEHQQKQVSMAKANVEHEKQKQKREVAMAAEQRKAAEAKREKEIAVKKARLLEIDVEIGRLEGSSTQGNLGMNINKKYALLDALDAERIAVISVLRNNGVDVDSLTAPSDEDEHEMTA